MPILHSGEVTLEVHVEGDGPTAVLVPSLGRGAGDLAAVASALAGHGMRVLRPEPRGCGGSVGPMSGLSYVDWAADVAAVVRALGAAPAVLIGHAAGTRYARMAAALFPELVAGVVAAAAAARRPPAHLGGDLFRAADPDRPVAERETALRRAFFAPGHDPRGWLAGWSPGTLAAQHATTASAGWSGAGRAPVLDLIGEHDAWRPPASRSELRDLLGPRVTVEVIAGAGHALPTEQPVAMAAAVAAWAACTFG